MSLLSPRVRALLREHGLRWLRQAGKSLRQLWLEVTGALFLGLAAFALPAILREWRRYEHGDGSLGRILVVALFIGMTVSFGVYSFIKARRMR